MSCPKNGTLSGSTKLARDISLTMGARGLMNRWGDDSTLTPYFGGDHSIPGTIYGRGNKKSSSLRDHKINLMGDHYFRIFVPMPHKGLFTQTNR